jgi:hypothetical protein
METEATVGNLRIGVQFHRYEEIFQPIITFYGHITVKIPSNFEAREETKER